MDAYHWDVLVTYHWDVVGCFIWDLFETYWRRTDKTSSIVPLRRCHDILIRRCGDVPPRRLGDVPLRHHWVFHLKRNYDVAGTYRETSLQCCHDILLPGGLIIFIISFISSLEIVNVATHFLMNSCICCWCCCC